MNKLYKINNILIISSIIVFIIAIIVVVNKSNKSESNQINSREIKLDKIKNDLEDKYSNYSSNHMIKDDMTKELEVKIDSVYKLGYLNDVPMKVRMIERNPHGKGALIQFHSDNFRGFNFDIIGFTDADKAALLHESEKYILSGKILERLNETEASLIIPRTFYSTQISIKPTDERKFFYNYNLGVFLMEIDKAELYVDNL